MRQYHNSHHSAGLVCDFASVLTVLALKIEELLLHACQLGLQSLDSGPVVVLQLPQLFPVGLTLALNPGRQICLSLRQICLQGNIF